MRRLALALSLVVVAAPVARADDPPPWMPTPPPGPTGRQLEEARTLRREAAAFGTIGLVLFAGGVAVNVVALDVPQAETTMRQPDGNIVEKRVLGDANWAELAGGIVLMVTGFALVTVSLFRRKQAARVEAGR